ncbi:MAG: DUF1579 domain-containing protein [Phycisphaerales bacterium]|nr:DUF1579 domain-containing protein [Phycisphaerales bacterium]
MNRKTGLALVGAVVAGGAIATAVNPPEWLGTRTEEEAMQAMMEAGRLHGPHEFLGKTLGTYDCVMKFWMDPSQPPMEAKATAVRSWKIEGRWVQEDFSCPDLMGQPFQGYSLMGWDNIRRQFVTTWCDSMTTSLMVQHGSISRDMKTITSIGEMDEPTTGEIGKPVKYVTRQIDDDHAVLEAYEILYGDEFKVMEITYARRK